MALQRILLNSDPGQQFSTIVSGNRVVFTFRYNVRTSRFYFDVDVSDVRVISGRTLILGVDVLAAYSMLALGNLFAIDINEDGSQPTLENIVNGKVRVYLNN